MWAVDEDRTAGLLASGSFASFPAFPLRNGAVVCGVERSVARHSGATAAELFPLCVVAAIAAAAGGTHGIPYSPQRVAGAPFDQYWNNVKPTAVASFRHREDA